MGHLSEGKASISKGEEELFAEAFSWLSMRYWQPFQED
jgi:hypothetical protein